MLTKKRAGLDTSRLLLLGADHPRLINPLFTRQRAAASLLTLQNWLDPAPFQDAAFYCRAYTKVAADITQP